MTPEDFTDFLRQQIPLAEAMQIRVLACDRNRMEIAAPLLPNRNHRGTGFGGSLSTLGILCGWALVHNSLRADGIRAHVAVRDCRSDFRTAVEADFNAVSVLPEANWTRFLDSLHRHHRGAIEIETVISTSSGPHVRHSGRYAASIDTTITNPVSESQ